MVRGSSARGMQEHLHSIALSQAAFRSRLISLQRLTRGDGSNKPVNMYLLRLTPTPAKRRVSASLLFLFFCDHYSTYSQIHRLSSLQREKRSDLINSAAARSPVWNPHESTFGKKKKKISLCLFAQSLNKTNQTDACARTFGKHAAANLVGTDLWSRHCRKRSHTVPSPWTCLSSVRCYRRTGRDNTAPRRGAAFVKHGRDILSKAFASTGGD